MIFWDGRTFINGCINECIINVFHFCDMGVCAYLY